MKPETEPNLERAAARVLVQIEVGHRVIARDGNHEIAHRFVCGICGVTSHAKQSFPPVVCDECLVALRALAAPESAPLPKVEPIVVHILTREAPDYPAACGLTLHGVIAAGAGYLLPDEAGHVTCTACLERAARPKNMIPHVMKPLSISEAAELLGVSEAKLRRWDDTRKFRARRHPVNGRLLYDYAEVMGLRKRILQGRPLP
jgi:hypothetical protein